MSFLQRKPAAKAQGRIERVDGVTVTGWAHGRSGDEGVLRVRVRGEPVLVTVSRRSRQDVASALVLPAEGTYGFDFRLPPQVWAQPQAPGLEVFVDGEALVLPDLALSPDDLAAWVEAHLAQAGPAERSTAAREALDYLALADVDLALSPDVARRFALECRKNGWTLPARLQIDVAEEPESGATGPRPIEVRGAIERVEGPVIAGWAARTAGVGEVNLRVLANDRPLDCGLIRTERRDVQDALAIDELMTGFEVEVPGLAWQAEAGAEPETVLMLRVFADDVELTAVPLAVRREDVAAWVAAERQANATPPPPADVLAQRNRQYRALLVLEHATIGGVHDLLTPAEVAWLSSLAERFSLAPWVAAQALARSPVAEGPEPDDEAPVADALLWDMQRRFNAARLLDAGDPEAALSRVLMSFRGDEVVWTYFLQATVPYFCSLGRFDAVRSRLSSRHVGQLAEAGDQWQASLALPFLLHDVDAGRLTALLWRLAGRPPGWLNTECVLEVARCIGAGETDPRWRADQVEEVLWALIGLFESLHGDYWSRMHDQGLMKAMVWMLRTRSRLSDALVGAIERSAQRHYALAPDFWALLQPHLDGAEPGDTALKRGALRLQRIADLLAPNRALQTSDLPALWQDLDALRGLGAYEVAQFEREFALALAPLLAQAQLPEGAGLPSVALQRLDAIDPLEPLRLAASPLPDAPTLAALADGVWQRVRAASATPHSPVFRLQQAAAGVWRRFEDAVDRQDAAALAALHGDIEDLGGRLTRESALFVGLDLRARAWCLVADLVEVTPAQTQTLARHLKVLHRDLGLAVQACIRHPAPPAAVCTALWHLAQVQVGLRSKPLGAVLKDLTEQVRAGWGDEVALDLMPAADPMPVVSALPASTPRSDTLVVVYSCKPNLGSRVQAMRDTWLRDLTARGVPWCVAVGGDRVEGGGHLDGDVLVLDAPDDYESLPQKTLALLRWVQRHTQFAYVMKIDDDCHVDVDRLLEALATRKHHYLGRPLRRAEGGTHRYWHQIKSRSRRGAMSIDKSPEPSTYADGGSGYLLSRFALARLERARRTTGGAQASRSAFMEDKLVGDLLSLQGLEVAGEDYEVLVRRRLGPGAMPVATYGNIFLPSRLSPTIVSHLDSVEPLPALQQHKTEARLAPGRLWPTMLPPTLGHTGATNQLELLSPPERAAALREAGVIVVAVARNEAVMAPHFLAHYRRLGVRHFVFVDNLSDDGTREWLHAQPDVVLYSADTDYRQSHFGVSWQQAVLAAHALGRWVLLADLDEFLVFDGCEHRSLVDHVQQLEAEGADAASVWMIDMYPEGELDEADMSKGNPFDIAPCFDRQPLLPWVSGSGCFSNAPTFLSALRHRLIPNSAPNHYTSQKVALLRYQPWMRLSEGLHYAANVRTAAQPLYFAHFKYHAGFRRKVLDEIARKQHFNGAEEYRKYTSLLTEAAPRMYDPVLSRRYEDSRSFSSLTSAAQVMPSSTSLPGDPPAPALDH